jgi:iron complex transport system permease protein
MSSLVSSTRASSRPALDRRLIVLLLALLALLAALVLSVGAGPVYLGPATVWRALLNDADPTANLIVRQLRLPRVLVGAMVGANLAVAGAILQGVTRNPLADPHVVGISAGAGVGAIGMIVLNPGAPLATVAPVAFGSGMAAGALVYVLAWRGGVSPVRLALAGVAVTAMLTAVIAAILVHSSLAAPAALTWLVGGLAGRDWEHFRLLAPYFAVGLPVALLAARQVNVIALGDEVATGLGQRVERTRLLLIGVAAILASSAVSVAGLVGFIGLIIPHFARLLVGNDYRLQLPAAAVFGATLLVLADSVARVAFDPRELPVGVLTALIGGPVFVYLVRGRG